MSDVMGINFTKAASPVMNSLLGADWRGKVRVCMDRYEAASLAVGSTIKVAQAKKDEVFVIGFVIADDLTSTGTLILGDSGDPDRFLAATVFTTAGQITTAGRINAGGTEGVGYKFTADTDIILTTATEEMTGTIQTIIFLACPN